MVYHLKNKHAEQYSEYKKKFDDKQKQTKEVMSSSTNCNRQLTLQETRKWDISDVHAQ